MRAPRLLKRLIRASVPLTCLAYMADDWRFGRRLKHGRFETESGATHASLPLDESLAYIERIYRDYCRDAGVQAFTGTIAEIGPGDNFGLALLLLRYGAGEVHAIDRYYSRRDARAQGAIYAALAERHGLSHLFEGGIAEERIRGLTYHVGQAAETFFAERGLRFDAVLSRAVMEHLYDPIRALEGMLGALKPGGRLVHRIDLRDHGMFANRHPLIFLTVPDSLYRRMTRHSGRPNRVLLPEYRAWAGRAGCAAQFLITRLVGHERDLEPAPWAALDLALREEAEARVGEMRARLAPRFRAFSDADLAVAGFVLSARKGMSG